MRASNSPFNTSAKEQQAEHVEQQMPDVRVQKARRDQTIVLLAGQDRFGIENILLLEPKTPESTKGHHACHTDYYPGAPRQ